MRSLLTAADLMELTADLTEMQTKARKKAYVAHVPTTLQVSPIDRLMIFDDHGTVMDQRAIQGTQHCVENMRGPGPSNLGFDCARLPKS